MKKLSLYFHTIRYLTWIQIRYQLLSRLRQVLFSIHHYTKFSNRSIYPVLYSYLPCVVSDKLYIGHNTFLFLHLEKSFGNEIDWTYNGYGRLWNYNLQYFDYLNDPEIDPGTSIRLINSFSDALLAKRIKPEPFPVSLRLINWILFHSRTGYQDPAFLSAILLQIGYLEKNVEHHLQANHLLENYFTLSVCGFFLRDDQMIRKYITAVKRELDKQLLDDGGHIEGSPMYHSLLLSKVLLLIDVLEKQAYNPQHVQKLKENASAMLAWLDTFCNSEGQYAFVNDATPGIAVEPPVLFERANLMGIYWQSVKLAGSGYRKINAGKLRITIDVADIMPAYQPGHAHSDMLHFTLELDGKPVFAEAGTSTYENNERREYERSTAAHNTVIVNEKDQSEMWGSFRVAKRAKITLQEDSAQVIRASHDGYKNQGVIHSRRFSSNGNKILVMDELQAEKEQPFTAVANFHMAPAITIAKQEGNLIVLSNDVHIQFGNAIKIETVPSETADGFNRLVKTQMIIVQFSKKLQTQITIP